MLGCITCDNAAEHSLKYDKHFNDYVHWEGDYCTDCFVKKLRGMATVWSKYLK